jgi:hypothetical protein
MIDPTLKTYVDASLALHGYELTDAQRAGVYFNFQLAANIAKGFLGVPLSVADESIAVYVPHGAHGEGAPADGGSAA